MMKTFRAAALILALSEAAVLPGCGRHGEEARAVSTPDSLPAGTASDPEAAPAVAVRARAVEERSFEDAVAAPGRWRSAGQVVVSAPFAGTLDSLAARIGDHVSKGQVLCRLITRESAAAMRGAEFLAREARDDASRTEAARALDLARRELVRVPVLAPRAGTITEVSVQSGSEILESTEILAIQAPDAIVFEARVDPSDARRIFEGQRASVIDQGRNEPRAAVVHRILPMADPSDQAALVWLTPQPSAGPPPVVDRFGTATITAGAPHRAPAVPDSAVVQDDLTGRNRVAVIDAEQRVIWTPVTLGTGAAGWHELLSPEIALGTRLVTRGHRGLPDSTRVEPTP